MRILQVFPAFNTGGVEEGALAISNALQKHEHRSFLVSSGGKKVADAKFSGAHHITLPLNHKNIFLVPSLINQLSQIIKDHKIDIVHARSRWPAWIAYFAAKRNKVPFITTFHGIHKTQNQLKKTYNSIMVRSPHVISISDYVTQHIQQTYVDYLESYHTQIHTIPRGIDISRFDPKNVNPNDVALLRQTWQIKPGQKIILLPARLTRLKGHHVLIEALSKVVSRNWTAILVGAQAGDETYQQELGNKIRDSQLVDQVKIVSATQQMPAAYALADIVVFPSTQPEAFGRIVIESQAMETPVITSNIGAQATLVKEGQTGWLFENGNSFDLALKIGALLDLSNDNKDNYARLVRQNVIESYTEALMCQRTLEVYNQAWRESKR